MTLLLSLSLSLSLLPWFFLFSQAGPLQTREYLYHGPIPGWTLGLRLHMQKMHFQMPELRLKCVAIHHDIIKEYQTTVNVIAKNYELVEAASSSASSGLTFTARPFLVIISTSLSGTLILCSFFFAQQKVSSTFLLIVSLTFAFALSSLARVSLPNGHTSGSWVRIY